MTEQNEPLDITPWSLHILCESVWDVSARRAFAEGYRIGAGRKQEDKHVALAHAVDLGNVAPVLIADEVRRRVQRWHDNESSDTSHGKAKRYAFRQVIESLIDVPEAPVGVPESFEEHATLMFDFLALAFQADLTRVFTFMMARELSQRTYPQHRRHRAAPLDLAPRQPAGGDRGAREGEHAITWACSRSSSSGCRTTPDGDGSLLDHSLILYGSGMGNGNVHAADHLPTLLVGGGAGAMKGNRHIVAPERTPNGNMLVSVAEKMGVDMDSFGSQHAACRDL